MQESLAAHAACRKMYKDSVPSAQYRSVHYPLLQHPEPATVWKLHDLMFERFSTRTLHTCGCILHQNKGHVRKAGSLGFGEGLCVFDTMLTMLSKSMLD